jgi:hypothetical protein
MIKFHCDGCGTTMKRGDLRYSVSIDVRAAYDEIQIGLADLVKDHRAEIVELLHRMRHKSPQEVEAQVYKKIELDLCPACQHAFIANPLRFHPEQGTGVDAGDIDAFLKSLGYGKDTP